MISDYGQAGMWLGMHTPCLPAQCCCSWPEAGSAARRRKLETCLSSKRLLGLYKAALIATPTRNEDMSPQKTLRHTYSLTRLPSNTQPPTVTPTSTCSLRYPKYSGLQLPGPRTALPHQALGLGSWSSFSHQPPSLFLGYLFLLA